MPFEFVHVMDIQILNRTQEYFDFDKIVPPYRGTVVPVRPHKSKDHIPILVNKLWAYPYGVKNNLDSLDPR